MISWVYNLPALSLGVTPIILLLLWLKPLLSKRYSARWRYILWLVVAIRMLLPVPLANYLPVSIGVPAPAAIGPALYIATNAGPISRMNPLAIPELGMSPGQILFVVYLTGILVYLAYELLAYVGFRRNVLRWGRKPADDAIETLLNERKTALNIKRDVPVKISKKVSSPMIVGIARPVLLLPVESYPPAELRMILTHELVHLKRHDIWSKFILMLATAVHWFNPVVHLMVREANKDMEKSCDDYVLRNTDAEAKKRYCNIILNLAVQNKPTEGPIFSTSISSSRENLESRIKGIFDTGKKGRGVAFLASIAVLVTMSGAMVNLSRAEPLTDSPLQNKFTLSPLESENGTGDHLTGVASSPQTGDSSKAESSTSPRQGRQNSANVDIQEYTAAKPAEDLPSNENQTEIVIVDLNQLEDALAEDEPAAEPER